MWDIHAEAAVFLSHQQRALSLQPPERVFEEQTLLLTQSPLIKPEVWGELLRAVLLLVIHDPPRLFSTLLKPNGCLPWVSVGVNLRLQWGIPLTLKWKRVFILRAALPPSVLHPPDSSLCDWFINKPQTNISLSLSLSNTPWRILSKYLFSNLSCPSQIKPLISWKTI